MTKSNCLFVFFLGGDDAEMRRIKEILAGNGQRVEDKNLGWNTAKASAYQAEIAEATKQGLTPVLVELIVDCDLSKDAVVIDHHGARSGEPPALIQVLSLLGTEPERRDYLIGAMDAGFIFGLESIGATQDEIAEFLSIGSANGRSIREMLLAVEKMDPAVVAEAERALAAAEKVGNMIVVRPANSKTAPITTRLVGEQDYQNILILSGDGEVNYYGTGDTVRGLVEHFPGGWSGGAGLHPATAEGEKFWTTFGGSVPNNAFYGRQGGGEEILNFLTARFS